MELHPLLKKVRFEVLAPGYPGSPFTPGEIITLTPGARPNQDFILEKGKCLYYYELIKYPALFRELAWWHDRQLFEMPDYVHIDKRLKAYMPDGVYAVTWEFLGHKGVPHFVINDERFKPTFCTPATLADYNAFIRENAL